MLILKLMYHKYDFFIVHRMEIKMRTLLIIFLLISFPIHTFGNEKLQTLSNEFFQWRATTQPATTDDINRVERPNQWIADFSTEALETSRKKYSYFKNKLFSIPQTNFTRSDSIDFLLINSAIDRVKWEIDVLKLPYRNPDFYINQTLGILYELLIINSPMDDNRIENIITRLNSFEKTLKDATVNLQDPIRIFAEIAMVNAHNHEERLIDCANGLKLLIDDKYFAELDASITFASKALSDYLNWLENNLDKMSNDFVVGKDNYEYFLKNIALLPYSPDQLIRMGDQSWNRAVAFEQIEELKNIDLPQTTIFETIEDQIGQEKIDEIAIREFLEDKHLMTVPEWLMHYKNIGRPPHLEPFTNMGVVDDLTSPTRLDEDAVAYIPEPSPELSYFYRAIAQDPRPIIVHEGIPGHYFQMAISWKHPNPIRRHYFDSGPMEGIAFYVEELMLQMGLFDDRPRTREIMYNFMRLRALRVMIDVKLALGDFTIEEAGKYLADTIPMDYETAIDEARFFAMTPGQAITYQIGKLQILDFLADAIVQQGEDFVLKDFHDYLIENGNVPISLLRWELLGLTDEIDQFWVSN